MRRRRQTAADVIREWRAKRGYTQPEAAAYFKVKVGTWVQWEQGRREPASLKVIAQLMKESEES